MKLLLLITLIGIEATSCNFLTFSFAHNRDTEDELENLDYPQQRQNGANERDPAVWELWDRQNDYSKIKDTESSDNFEDDKTNEGFEKPVQNAVKRESGSSGNKCPTVLQIDPVGEINKNSNSKKEELQLHSASNNGKKSGTRSGSRTCKTHSTHSLALHTHRPACETHHTATPLHRTTNWTNTTSEATETILVQEPFKLDSNEVYSVCDMDGNWSWALSTNESKKWLRWLWVLPCLLLATLLFLLFIRTCQNYAEQRATCRRNGGGNEGKCRNKLCQQMYQDQFRDQRTNACSPLIRKLEPRRYQSPGPASVVSHGMGPVRGPFPSQSQMGQMRPHGSQMGPQMAPGGQRKHGACPPMSPNPQMSGMSRTGKQNLVLLRSPPPFALPRKPSCACSRAQPQPYYGPPLQQNVQTHLQQQCVPLEQQQQRHQRQQMMPNYTEARPTSGPPYMFCPPQSPSPKKMRSHTPPPLPPPPRSPPRECSHSPSPKPNENS